VKASKRERERETERERQRVRYLVGTPSSLPLMVVHMSFLEPPPAVNT
jgi:hypothetical protein